MVCHPAVVRGGAAAARGAICAGGAVCGARTMGGACWRTPIVVGGSSKDMRVRQLVPLHSCSALPEDFSIRVPIATPFGGRRVSWAAKLCVIVTNWPLRLVIRLSSILSESVSVVLAAFRAAVCRSSEAFSSAARNSVSFLNRATAASVLSVSVLRRASTVEF